MKKPKKYNNEAVYRLPCKGGKISVVSFQLKLLSDYAQTANIHTLVDLCGGGGKIALTANHPTYSGVFSTIRYNEIEPCVCNLLWLLQSNTRRKWLFDNLYSTITNTADLRTLFQKALDFTTMELNIKTKEVSALSDEEKEMLHSDGLRKNRYMSGLYGAILVYGSARNNKKTMEITGTRTGTVPSLGKQFEFVDDTREHIGRSKQRWCQAFTTMMTNVVPGLKNVQITNCDAFDFLRRNNQRSDMLVYIDPPYVNDGKEANDYKCAWTLETHKELVEICKKTKLKVMLCYGNSTQVSEGKSMYIKSTEELSCYQDLLESPGWYRYACKKSIVDEYGYVGKGDSSSNANEIVICNFAVPGVDCDGIYCRTKGGAWRKF